MMQILCQLVNFGVEILRIIPGRVSTEVDARFFHHTVMSNGVEGGGGKTLLTVFTKIVFWYGKYNSTRLAHYRAVQGCWCGFRACFDQNCIDVGGHSGCACSRKSTWNSLQYDAGVQLLSGLSLEMNGVIFRVRPWPVLMPKWRSYRRLSGAFWIGIRRRVERSLRVTRILVWFPSVPSSTTTRNLITKPSSWALPLEVLVKFTRWPVWTFWPSGLLRLYFLVTLCAAPHSLPRCNHKRWRWRRSCRVRKVDWVRVFLNLPLYSSAILEYWTRDHGWEKVSLATEWRCLRQYDFWFDSFVQRKSWRKEFASSLTISLSWRSNFSCACNKFDFRFHQIEINRTTYCCAPILWSK